MRSSGGVRRHSGNAAAAASTAAFTSAAPPIGTLAMTSPVAGFTTSRHSDALEPAHWPLMYWVNLLAGGAATLMDGAAFRYREEWDTKMPCRLTSIILAGSAGVLADFRNRASRSLPPGHYTNCATAPF